MVILWYYYGNIMVILWYYNGIIIGGGAKEERCQEGFSSAEMQRR